MTAELFNPDFQEQLIQEFLLDRGTISPEQLSKALARLREYKMAHQKNQRAVSYVVDQVHYTLKQLNPWTGECVRELALPSNRKQKPRFFSTDWFPFGSGNVCLFQAKNGREVGEISWGEEVTDLGLTVSDQFVHLYFGGLDEHPYLALSDHLPYGFTPIQPLNCLPVDMYLSPSREWLFLSDRGRGTIFIVDLISFKLAGSLVVRPPGSRKTLNMVCSPDDTRLFITDSHTPALLVVMLKTLKIKRYPLPYGILGNLKMDPEGQWLYLQSLKPDQSVEVIVLDAQNLLYKTTIPLRGQLFSQLDDPLDLMAISPENNYLLLMTYVNAPAMFTPWINIMDLQSYELIDRYALLSDDNKPSLLAFSTLKPEGYFKVDTTILDVLMELGYISVEDVEDAELNIQATLSSPATRTHEPEFQLQFEPDFEDTLLSFEPDPAEESALAATEAQRGKPEEDYPVLHQYQIDPSILIRFKEEWLQNYEFVPINNLNGILRVAAVDPKREEIQSFVKKIYPDDPIHMIPFQKSEFERFMREFYHFIMSRMKNIISHMNTEQKEQFEATAPAEVLDNLGKYKVAPATEPEPVAPIVPDPPPEPDRELEPEAESTETAPTGPLKELSGDLLEKILMAYCINEFKKIWGVDLNGDTDALAKLTVPVQKAIKELSVYDYTIIRVEDLFNNFSLETAITREKLHQLVDAIGKPILPETDKRGAKSPVNATNNKLKAFIERNPTESLATDLDEEAFGPDSLPNDHFLVHDHEMQRVVEFNHKGLITWQVGGPDGIGPLELEEPYHPARLPNGSTLITDAAQDKIFEVSRSGQLRWQFPPEDRQIDISLRRPVQAIRRLNGNTLIVDQGNHRIIEINSMAKIVWQYGITSSVGISRGRLYSPSYMQVLKGGHFLITDTDNHRVIEVTQDEEIVWQYGNLQNKLGSGYGSRLGELNSPSQAIRLPNGNTLITDTENRRVLEVTPEREITWMFDTDIEKESQGAFSFMPTRVFRRENGNTIVFSSLYVIEVTAQLRPVYLYQYSLLPKAPDYDEQRLESEKIVELSSRPSPERISELARQAAQHYVTTKANLLDIEIPLVDKQENRVYIVSRQKTIVWRFGDNNPSSPQYVERPQCVESIPGDEYAILITDTDRHRVLMVYRPTKEIVWQYGQTGIMGSTPDHLGHPRSAVSTPQDTILITDQYSGRVIEVNLEKEILWSYGGWDNGINPLNGPYYAEKTPEGNVLITDWSNHFVIEVDPDGEIVWKYGTLKNPGNGPGQLMYPERAHRLSTGNTMIVDTRNHRVLEVDPEGGTFWQYGGLKSSAESYKKITNPTSARRLENGNTLIVHSSSRQIIEVTYHHEVVWQYLMSSRR